MNKDLLKKYIKSIIISESLRGVSSSVGEANAIFGNAISTSKEVYDKLTELDLFFYNYKKTYKNIQDFMDNPPPPDILQNIDNRAFNVVKNSEEYSDEWKVAMAELYASLSSVLDNRRLTSFYMKYIKNIMGMHPLGRGASRIVYDIGNDFVLKLMNDRTSISSSFNQNRIESNPQLQTLLYPYVPIVYTRSRVSPGEYFLDRDGYHWMISEKCEQIPQNGDGEIVWVNIVSSDTFKKLHKYHYMSDWIYFIIESEDNGVDLKSMSKLEKALLHIHKNNLLHIKDFHRENVGYGSDGRPVIIDTGYLLRKKN
jgi:hypothetical protein